MRWLDNITNSVDISSVIQSCLTLCDPMNRSTPVLHLSKLQEVVKDKEASILQSMGLQRAGHHLATKPGGSEVKSLPAMQQTQV